MHLVVHDTFNTVSQLLDRFGDDESAAPSRHSAPAYAGLKRATFLTWLVSCSTFCDFGITPEIEREVRKHYKGKLVPAQDFMVFNVTANDLVVRLAVTPTHVLRTNGGTWHCARLQPSGVCKCPLARGSSRCQSFSRTESLRLAETFQPPNGRVTGKLRQFPAGAGD
jgi:hypothetical protein